MRKIVVMSVQFGCKFIGTELGKKILDVLSSLTGALLIQHMLPHDMVAFAEQNHVEVQKWYAFPSYKAREDVIASRAREFVKRATECFLFFEKHPKESSYHFVGKRQIIIGRAFKELHPDRPCHVFVSIDGIVRECTVDEAEVALGWKLHA